jgi:hypothetical protein
VGAKCLKYASNSKWRLFITWQIFEIVKNIFGQPILHGSIEHKTILLLLIVKQYVLVNQRSIFVLYQNNSFHVACNCDAFSGDGLQLKAKNLAISYFQFLVKLSEKMMKTEIIHHCKKYIFDFYADYSQRKMIRDHHFDSAWCLHNPRIFCSNMLKIRIFISIRELKHAEI